MPRSRKPHASRHRWSAAQGVARRGCPRRRSSAVCPCRRAQRNEATSAARPGGMPRAPLPVHGALAQQRPRACCMSPLAAHTRAGRAAPPARAAARACRRRGQSLVVVVARARDDEGVAGRARPLRRRHEQAPPTNLHQPIRPSPVRDARDARAAARAGPPAAGAAGGCFHALFGHFGAVWGPFGAEKGGRTPTAPAGVGTHDMRPRHHTSGPALALRMAGEGAGADRFHPLRWDTDLLAEGRAFRAQGARNGAGTSPGFGPEAGSGCIREGEGLSRARYRRPAVARTLPVPQSDARRRVGSMPAAGQRRHGRACEPLSSYIGTGCSWSLKLSIPADTPGGRSCAGFCNWQARTL
eukprot:scaffold659_cov329-Prasinococcus_capsulatus_cf.AAC.24